MYFKIEQIVNVNTLWFAYQLKKNNKWMIRRVNNGFVTVQDAENSKFVKNIMYPFSATNKLDANEYVEHNKSKYEF